MNRSRACCIAALVLAVAGVSCGDRSSGDRPSDTSDAEDHATPVTATRAWTTADGNRIPYDVTGEGDVTVVLVHCWMCERSFWDAQVPVLAQSYRTIALDLPGHGEATSQRAEWSVAAFGDDLAGFMDALDLDNVVLVGHSMGGPVSLRAAALSGDRVRGIVAVDTLHDAEFEFSKEEMDAFMADFEADYPATCQEFVSEMFPEPDAGAAMSRVQAVSCRPERAPAGIALMRDYGNIEMASWFRDAGVPIRAINAAQPFPTRVDTNRKYADFDAVLMDDVGHYPHISRPAAFNPLLLDAIRDLAGGTG